MLKKKHPFKLTRKEKVFLMTAFLWCLVLSIFIAAILYGIFRENLLSEIATSFGSFVGVFVAFFGSILVYKALQSQIKANRIISDQFKIQQFENQFYQMLSLHKENVNEMNITGYYNSVEMTTEYTKAEGSEKIIRTEKQVDKFIVGRKVFVSMINELIFCCEFCINFNLSKSNKYAEDQMLKLAYRIFFFGSSSDILCTEEFSDKLFISEIQKELKDIRKKHRHTIGKYNSHDINGIKLDLYIKYSPFTGHVSRLGHYYRHLFYMVKFVVENERKELFDYNKSREYLKLLRAQMSNDEQLLLYYNFKIGFGSSWENDTNQFMSKYRMLHNLPTNIVKYSNPLLVFKNAIDEIKILTNGKETMFEWGDD